MPRPSRSRVDQSPLAVTSSGGIVIGLGCTRDLRSIEQAVRLLRDGEVTGALFVGVVMTGSLRRAALKQLDDAAAEVAATSGVGRHRSGRSHR